MVRRVIEHSHVCSNRISRDVPEHFSLALDRHRVVGILGANVFSAGNRVCELEVPGFARLPTGFANCDNTLGLLPICGLHLPQGTDSDNRARHGYDERPTHGERERSLL